MATSKERVVIEAMINEKEVFMDSLMERIQETDLSELGAESQIRRIGQVKMNTQLEVFALKEVLRRADLLE